MRISGEPKRNRICNKIRKVNLFVEDRVMVHMLGEVQDRACKLQLYDVSTMKVFVRYKTERIMGKDWTYIQ